MPTIFPLPTGTLHAHVIRSPHPHAAIVRIDTAAALAQDGVWAVITGEDVRKLSDPFLVALKAKVAPMVARGRPRALCRRAGGAGGGREPLSRRGRRPSWCRSNTSPIEAVIDPLEACKKSAPLLHAEAKTNEISVREFHYGDTKIGVRAGRQDRQADVEFSAGSRSRRWNATSCVAQYNPADGEYDVLANFQGPFSTHPVMAKALRVPGPKMRLRIPPNSGGSFGIKLSVFPYVVLTALAAKITGRPVKWVEDRAEHLVAASSGPNRVTEIEAAVTKDGRILGLKLDQLEDYGAFLRAPMPGPLYRMHGAITGGYDIANVDVVNRVVLTNKMPASLIRGFGGPQLYLALERLVQRIAIELGLDHLDVIRRNLVPANKFPYRAAAGALYDSGDYPRAVETAVGDGRLDDLKKRRDAARKAGKKYGIGFAVVVEPAMSNMGYLSTLLTPEARDKAGPKNGAVSMVTVNIDPLGAVAVTADVTVQGQGHETVLSQIVAEQLGLSPDDIDVKLEMDTAKDQWSIAAGTYSCRFTPGTAVAAHIAATRMADKLKAIGAKQLNVLPEDVELSGGKIRSRSNPDNAISFPPRRRHLALVAGDAAGRHGAGAKRDRDVEPAGAGAAVERRPHQLVADLRLCVRHVRHRDRSDHLPGAGRPLHLDARRRQDPQPADRRRPDARRLRPRHRDRAV